MIRHWKNTFREMIAAMRTDGSFVQNSLLMFSSSGASIILQFVFAFILSRIYSETDYGLFGIFNSYVAILGSIVTLNYNQAFVLPRDEHSFAALFQHTIRITIILCIAISLLTVLAGKQILEWMNHEEVGNWIYLVGPTCLVLALDKVIMDYAVREKAFKKMTLWSTLAMFFSKTFNVGYGMVNANAAGLIITNFLFYLAEMGLFMRFVTRKAIHTLRVPVTRHKRKEVIREYRTFPLYIFPGNFINTISNYLPPVLLASLGFGLEAVGYFTYSLIILDLPIRLMGSGVSSVFLPKANDMYAERPHELAPATWRLFKNMMLLSAASVAVIFIAGEPIYSLCFSDRWAPAGRIAEILTVFYFFRLLSAPLTVLFNVFRREREFLIFQTILMIVRVISLFTGAALTHDFETLVLIFSISNAAVYFGLCIWIFVMVKLNILKSVAFTLGWGIVIFGGGYLIREALFG
jgi:O-antigen/teichoic acid export membrane protein